MVAAAQHRRKGVKGREKRGITTYKPDKIPSADLWKRLPLPGNAGIDSCLRGQRDDKDVPELLRTGRARGKPALETLKGCLRAKGAFIYSPFDS